MRRSWLSYALVVSLSLNLGVIAAAGYHLLGPDGAAGARGGDLATHLELDGEQSRRWQQIEQPFVRELDAGWREIANHREKMILEVFSDKPDRARIEAERVRIAELQSVQQQRVIDQFLRERDILTPEQRRVLVDVLLNEQPPTTRERQLHEE